MNNVDISEAISVNDMAAMHMRVKFKAVQENFGDAQPCAPVCFNTYHRFEGIGRLCTRGRIIRQDELGQTFVVRLVIRL